MLAVVAIALSALASLLDGVDWSDVRDALTRIGWVRLLLAAGITATSYGVLTGYDVIALRVIGRRVAYPRAALASFTSYVFSHNFGFALLTGGTARWRIYRPAGLTIGEVGHVMVLTGLTFWSGVLLLLGIGLIASPDRLAIAGLAMSYPVHAAIGAASLALLGVVLILLHRRGGRMIVAFGRSIPVPRTRQALIQMMLASIDLVLAALVLVVLLPGASLALLPGLLLGYLVAITTGLITHAPGGVGVFEAVMLASLPEIDRATLFAALLAYRMVYFLIPLAIGMVLFALHEVDLRARVRSA
nr:lysylphosphatidylglycerol synthase domain-containing protein [Sphingomonas aerolata]